MERSSSITKLTKPPLARSFLPIPFAGALAAGVLAIVFIAPRGEPLVGTAQLSLAATRGVQAEALSPSIPPNHRISMQLDTQALPVSDSYKVRLVDSAGTLLWEAPAMVRDGSMAVDYPAGCEPGRYWVRVFNGRNELLREYGFLVTDRAQPASPSR